MFYKICLQNFSIGGHEGIEEPCKYIFETVKYLFYYIFMKKKILMLTKLNCTPYLKKYYLGIYAIIF